MHLGTWIVVPNFVSCTLSIIIFLGLGFGGFVRVKIRMIEDFGFENQARF